MAKIVFTPITREEVKPLILLAFKDDPDLLEKYSLLIDCSKESIPTLEQSVQKNFDTIIDAMENPVYGNGRDVRLYMVGLHEMGELTPIGFTVTVTNDGVLHELFSFGINIRYRTRKVVTNWLRGVRQMLGKFYYVALHENNKRAIEFFQKNGFTLKRDDIKKVVFLYSNYQELIRQKNGKIMTHGS